MPTYRLFIACHLSESALKAIQAVQNQLKSLAGVRWTKPSQFHLTLQFLGDTPSAKIDPLIATLHTALSETPAFSLAVEGLGVFPTLKRPRVIWLGFGEGTQALTQLQRKVVQATAEHGFEAEKRRYSPHLTLGRVNQGVSAAERAEIGRHIEALNIGHVATSPVETVSLIRSQLKPSGAVYTTLAEFALV